MVKGLKLLLNDDSATHGDEIVGLIQHAEHLECMVAFAKYSAKETLLKPLEGAVARGMTARIAIGLSMYVTEPAMLYEFLKLEKDYGARLKLYLSATDVTFHPKIYAVREPKGHKVIIGSANLTAGGFADNYEASIVVGDRDGELMESVEEHFESLINQRVLIRATKSRINEYAKLYAVHEAWRKMASRRAEKISRGDLLSLDVLADRLADMKKDKTAHGFAAQRASRKQHRGQARRQIQEMAALGKITAAAFLKIYEDLITWFHSSGLHRGKGIIATNGTQFVTALADILKLARANPSEAFDLLHSHFVDIDRAGINVLTEILHALDNKRYAVMNQNAVQGLMVAGYGGYPLRPLKTNVSPALYGQFCSDAREVQNHLGLENFTELDALFNYVYWLGE